MRLRMALDGTRAANGLFAASCIYADVHVELGESVAETKLRATNHRRPCPVAQLQSAMCMGTSMPRALGNNNNTAFKTGEILTNREKASLNSETCSSVRESACCFMSATRDTAWAGYGRVLQGGVWKHDAVRG